MPAGSSTNRMSGPGRLIDSKAVAGTGSATDISFDEAACNVIMIESAGSVTITKLKAGASETFAALAVGIWHPMADFVKVTTCPANTHVGIAEGI
jgi:hypothetical protein